MLQAQWSFRRVLHTFHALLLGFPIALFSAALITDITYLNTAHIQWTNFSSWLIAGALVGGGGVIVCALLALLLDWRRTSRRFHFVTALLAVLAGVMLFSRSSAWEFDR